MIPAKPSPPLYYQSFPSLEQWAKDSGSQEYAQQRKSDPVMQRIDDLVRSLQRTGDDGQRKYLLCELFFSTSYWIQQNCVGPTLARRYLEMPVSALKNYVQRALATAFGCSRLMVPAVLQKHYSCSMVAHGIFADSGDVPRSFQARCRLEKYKVWFEKGRAYSYAWWTKDDNRVVMVSTFMSYLKSGTEAEHLRPGYGFFVMTSDRDIYVAPHRPGTQTMCPKFHSTIPQGKAVQCAGSMLVVEGIVKEIANDSGHYAPGNLYFVNILEQLKTVGASIKGIKLYDHVGELVSEDAEKYLEEYGKWERIEERGKLASKARKLSMSALRADTYKKRLDGLEQSNSKEKALEVLFSERFEQVRQGGPGGPSLWTETWKGIVEDLIAFYKEGGMGGSNRVKFYRERLAAYQTRPPLPPKPKDLKNLVPV